jgi:hypothetical protein
MDDKGTYNPVMTETEHLRARKQQSPKLKIDDGTRSLIKLRMELRGLPRRQPDGSKRAILSIARAGKRYIIMSGST